MTISSKIIEEESDLAALEPAWDGLAVASGRPFCSPAWMLAWWRHARPRGARLWVVAVEEGGKLIGIAPFCARRAGLTTTYEVLTGRLSPPVGPLAAPGREAEVAFAIGTALAERGSSGYLRVWDRFEAGELTPLIADSWPRRPAWSHTAVEMSTPMIAFEGDDPEAWIQSLPPKVRQEVRRQRRRLDEAGAECHAIGVEERGAALDQLLRLHAERWQGRGGSRALVPGLRGMLDEAAWRMLPEGRMRLLTMTVEGRTVAATMILGAGEEEVGWLGGFDAAWARRGVSMVLIVEGIEGAIRAGKTFDLGPGDMAYKRRLANASREISGVTIVPRTAAYPLTRAHLMPYQARWELSARLAPETKAKVTGGLDRLRRQARQVALTVCAPVG